jgi:hypothetical protein
VDEETSPLGYGTRIAAKSTKIAKKEGDKNLLKLANSNASLEPIIAIARIRFS